MPIRISRRTTNIRRLGYLSLGLAAVGAVILLVRDYRGETDPLDTVSTAPVRRVTLQATVVEDGEVDSTEKTLIECELENLSFRNGGGSIQASGSSAIIELVPEGTMVKKGQMLCRLDGSEYEEMVRQQEIELQEDLAEYNSVKLTVETLEIQLREYRDGLFIQQKEQLLGQLSMAKADVERQTDRLAWSRRMAELGYMPLSRLQAEENLMLQTRLSLNQATIAYNNLLKYTAPKMLIELQSQIDGGMANLRFHESRVQRDREQLARYHKQVERCTIRAPHDGFLIYAHDDDDDERIELGTVVRENQDLFYLPDLTQMEIRTELHESVLRRVAVGMPARARIEALPDVRLEGEVVHIAPLPKTRRSRYESDEIKNYVTRIQLHVVPEGLMPGMTAQVEILTGHRPEALVIPPQALKIEDGRDVCYVAGPRGVERRPITIGEFHPQMIEVVEGLAEGERVLLDLDGLDPNVPIVAEDEHQGLDTPSENGAVAALARNRDHESS